MKKICLVVAALAALPLFAHCAQASKASSEDSAAAKEFQAPADRGVVYLYRTGRMMGAAVAIEVKVNGQAAGGTSPGSFFRWQLKPGPHTFYSSTGESSATVQVNVEAGKLYFIEQNARIGLDSGRVTMSQRDVEGGKKRVKGMKLLVSAYVPD